MNIQGEFAADLRMPRFGITTFPTNNGLPVVDLARAVEESLGLKSWPRCHWIKTQ
jgi:hypothetical protein